MYNGRDGVVTDGNGLIYMRARYYSPELRRFVNADILAGRIDNAVTLNRYAYANGNPVSLIDPRGLSADERGTNILNPLENSYGDSWLEYNSARRNDGHGDTTFVSNSESAFNAKLEKNVITTTIDNEFDLSMGTGLLKISHTQTYSTSQTIAGDDAYLIGVYAYSNQHIGAAQMDYGAGLDLFDIVNVDASISLKGFFELEVSFSVGVNIGDYSGHIDVSVKSNSDVTASIGLSRTLSNGDEINDQYGITGNFVGIVIAIATMGYAYSGISGGNATSPAPA